MNILIKNCNLISLDKNRKEIEYNTSILTENNKIKKIINNISKTEETQLIEFYKIDKIIDGTNKYVLPGFINTHAHIPMSIFKETLDGYTLQDWLNKKIWPIEDTLNEEDIYYASFLSCIEMIKSGTTMINDHYFFPESIAKAIIESGVRAEITRVLMDSVGNSEQRYTELNNFITNYTNINDRLTISVGIHGLYTTSSKYVEKGISLAEKNNLNVHIHFCENSQEVIDIKNNYNVNFPSEVLKKYFSNVNTILAHCVKLEDEDFNILKDLPVNVSHCPISNLKLGCGIADIIEMQKNNINVSLGTDGQGSGSSLDMFEAMKFTGLLQKGINENPQLLTAYEILKMATINGAKALNKENSIGSISEGKLADIIILDLSDIITQPINNIFSDIVYNAKSSNVITTIVNGNILMENRKLTNINENIIVEKCNEIIQKRSLN